jgi:uncharacterized repeat protein (TIGR01451 family)
MNDIRTGGRTGRHFPLLALPLLLFAAAASAKDGGCIELTTTASIEQKFRNSQGRVAVRLVPPGKVVPGDEIVWTITARNVCDIALDRVVIANPVPTHMKYIGGSATGQGTVVAYSLDGVAFGPAASLTVKAPDGTVHEAPPDAYRHVRWTYQGALAPGALASVRYRATVI